MTADEFKAGIRDVIEKGLIDQAWTYKWSDGSMTVDGELDLTDLADAVHAYIIDTLKPPFGKVDQ